MNTNLSLVVAVCGFMSILLFIMYCISLAENHKGNRGTLKQHQALTFGAKP